MPDGTIPVPLIIPGCVEIVTFAARDSNERRNVFHYAYTGTAPTAGELETLLEQWELSVIEAQEDLTHNNTVFYKALARDLGDPAGAFAERSMFRIGVDTNDAAPSSVSLCMSKRSGLRGKSRHCRFYLFDLSDNFFSKDNTNLGYLPLLNNLAENLLEHRMSERFVPCIASRKHLETYPIRSFTWDFTVDSQRRRISGRGA